MGRRFTLSTKLALAIGFIACVFVASYGLLERELSRLHHSLDESSGASQAMLGAAYGMERTVGDVASALVGAAAGQHLARERLTTLGREFDNLAERYRAHAPDNATRTLADTAAARFRAYRAHAERLAGSLEGERHAQPRQAERIDSLEREVGALARDPMLLADHGRGRRINDILELGFELGRELRGFFEQPALQSAWRVEQASATFERLLTSTLAQTRPLAEPGRVERIRDEIDALRAGSRLEMFRSREIDTMLAGLHLQHDALRTLIHTQLQGRAGAQVVIARNAVSRSMATARERLNLVLLLATVSTLLAVTVATNSFLRPLQRLVAALGGIGEGRLDARLDLARNDELGDLAQAFNQMAERLERLTVSRAYLDRILAGIVEGVLVVDADYRLRQANPGACALLGQAAAELAGRPLADLLLLPAGGRWPPDASDGPFECSLVDAQGRRRPVLVSVAALAVDASGSAREYVVTTTDIGLLKEAEANLARSHAELREAYQLLQSVQEEERTRLAREVHDEFGAVLTVMNTSLHMLAAALPADAPAAPPLLARLHDLIDRASTATDSIVNGLRPPILDHFGLDAALEWYVDDFAARTGLACSADLEEIPDLAEEQCLAVFRVAQECLTNIARHARAHHVEVRLSRARDHLELVVTDDGVGGLAVRSRDDRAGLRGMAERLRGLDGTLEVEDGPGGGTLIRARMPLVQPLRPPLAAAI